jgi:hypothetical protein
VATEWEIAAAIGTVAAAVVGLGGVAVAIWQTHHLKNRIDAEALSNARLHASRISGRLTKTSNVITGVHAAWVFRSQDALTVTYAQLMQYERYKRFAGTTFFIPDEATLSALLPLPNQCAHRIGRAFDLLEAVKIEAGAVDMETLTTLTDEKQRAYVLDSWAASIQEANAYLEVAVRECVKASELGAPFPSQIERFGEAD